MVPALSAGGPTVAIPIQSARCERTSARPVSNRVSTLRGVHSTSWGNGTHNTPDSGFRDGAHGASNRHADLPGGGVPPALDSSIRPLRWPGQSSCGRKTPTASGRDRLPGNPVVNNDRFPPRVSGTGTSSAT